MNLISCYDATMQINLLPNINCKQCNKTFTPKRRWQEFCSNECRKLYYKNNTVVIDRATLNALQQNQSK